MPPPKKPKSKASWQEFMCLAEEDYATARNEISSATCDRDSVFSISPVSLQTKTGVEECPGGAATPMPEDLSMKSARDKSTCQNISLNGIHDVLESDIRRRTLPPPGVNALQIGDSNNSATTEHPQLRNILLAASPESTSREASRKEDFSEFYSLDSENSYFLPTSPNSSHANRTHLSIEEGIKPAATVFSTHSSAKDCDKSIVLKSDACGWKPLSVWPHDKQAARMSEGDTYALSCSQFRQQFTYAYLDRQNAKCDDSYMDEDFDKSSKIQECFPAVPRDGRLPYDGNPADSNREGSPSSTADSTTHSGLDCDTVKRSRLSINHLPSKRQGLPLLMPQSAVYRRRITEVQNGVKNMKSFSGRTFASSVTNSKESDDRINGSSGNIEISFPSLRLTPPYSPAAVTTLSSKRSLRALLTEERDQTTCSRAPPSEDSVVVLNESSATERMQKVTIGNGRMDQWKLSSRSDSVENENSFEKPVVLTQDCHSSPELPSSSSCTENKRGKMAMDEKGVCRCQICDDAASGFHYGVWSCEGCKAFFKRSLHGPVDYICPATNNCTIDKLRRKSCQACRLRKCHEAGMVAGTTRKDKGLRPIGKKRKSGDEEPVDPEASSTAVNCAKMVRCDLLGNSPDMVQLQRSPQNSANSEKKHSSSFLLGSAHNNQNSFGGGTQMMSPLVERLLAIELPPRLADFDSTIVDSKLQLLCGLLGLINCQLVDIIAWSKALPDFSKSSLESRTRLLVTSWPELLILGTVWQSLPHTDTWVCAPNLCLTRAHCKVAMIDQLFVRIMQLVQVFRRLQLTQIELVLLRLTILLNSDANVTESQPALASLHNILDETLQQIPTDVSNSSQSRVARLLLTLPDIRQCSLLLLDVINNARHRDGVPDFELLHEMLDTDYEFVEMHRAFAATAGADG